MTEQPLNEREQVILRDLEQVLADEDPDLARQLQTYGTGRWAHLSPRRWSSSAYALIGSALLVTGLTLGVASAIVGGTSCIAFSAYRSREALGQLARRIDARLKGRPLQSP